MKYETYKKSKENFTSFLNQCKRAINKLYDGEIISTKEEWWSTIEKHAGGSSYWQILKKDGCLFINDGIFAISFVYDGYVYADFTVNFLKDYKK